MSIGLDDDNVEDDFEVTTEASNNKDMEESPEEKDGQEGEDVIPYMKFLLKNKAIVNKSLTFLHT